MTTVLTTVSMCVTWQAYGKHQVNLFLAEHFLPCVSPLVCSMSMNVCRPLLCSKVAPCAHELLCSSALRSLVSISICSALWIAESVWEIERYGCACACAFFLCHCAVIYSTRGMITDTHPRRVICMLRNRRKSAYSSMIPLLILLRTWCECKPVLCSISRTCV